MSQVEQSAMQLAVGEVLAMAGGDSGQDPDTRAGDSTASENGSRSRRSGVPHQADQTGAMAGTSAGDYFKGGWPVFLAGLPALVTLVALTFDLFPSLQPVTPPEVRQVRISNAMVAERRWIRSGREIVNVVLFDVQAVGYDADAIEVATLWLDAATDQRVEDNPQRHGILTTNTRTDRVVGWADVEYPFALPDGSSRCLFVRVLLYVAPESGEVTPGDDHPAFLLDFADTTPFNPYEVGASTCVPVLDPATPGV